MYVSAWPLRSRTTDVGACLFGGLNWTLVTRDVIHRAQLMQSNAETISKLERKYREYTDELRRRYL
jgi:hypothetical protein